MLFFPIKTDRRQMHTPWVNYAIITANVAAFLAFNFRPAPQGVTPAAEMLLDPLHPHWYQFISYQFRHADFWHLFGNMIFLYVFGNALEDRFGKIGYLAYYLAGGIIAGIGHSFLSDAPVLGASGSVAAVSGAYVILFPRVVVSIFYWFFYMIGTFEVSSILLIGLYVILDLLGTLGGSGGVAYGAHLAGYAFGGTIAMGLLLTRLMPREPYDLLAVLEHRRRRSQFRNLTRSGYKPWEHNRDIADQPVAPSTELDENQQAIAERRATITAELNAGNIDEAAGLYLDLLQLSPAQCLSQQAQYDIASHLMKTRQYPEAAHAYEMFIKTYPTYSQRDQIELILGVIYGRYVNQPDRARELLTAAMPQLTDPSQRDLAESVLADVGPGTEHSDSHAS